MNSSTRHIRQLRAHRQPSRSVALSMLAALCVMAPVQALAAAPPVPPPGKAAGQTSSRAASQTASQASSRTSQKSNRASIWTASWAAAQTAPYGTEVLPPGALNGATLRETVHLSTGGSHIRIRLANTFGERELHLASVHIALPAQSGVPGTIDPTSDHALTFAGQPTVTVPMGAEYLSDPIAMPVQPLSDLVLTLEIQGAPETLTVHAGARATAFYTASGASAGATSAQLPAAHSITRWYFLSGVEVAGPAHAAAPAGVVAAFGDSITDGHGATTDGNDRWPDQLARRLQASHAAAPLGVINEGIGGNRVLADGIGPNALSRFDRDVLAPPGVRTVIVLEGINDLGGFDRTAEHPQAAHDALVAQLESAFQQMAGRAHEHGIRILGGTLTPFVGSGYYHPGPKSEADRQALNTWIRTSGVFDGVIDFDAAIRDPAQPDHLAPDADSGDHLHPNPTGYRRMAEAISLPLLTRR